tara:strand:- start:54 stop:1868 length:1815 start_codon:yes stop_codon:yes gene_type:complete
MISSISYAFVSLVFYLFYCTFIKYIRIFPLVNNDEISKVVLITGCDTGFGHKLAYTASSAGFEVIALCKTEEGRSKFIKNKTENPSHTVVADLMNEKDLERVVKLTKYVIKNRGLYSIINNAGICIPGNIDWLPTDVFKKTMRLNFFVPIELTYKLLPEIKKACGRIINVTSANTLTSLPTMSPYSASIQALEAYSESLRREMLNFNVKVVLIQPSIMNTPFASTLAEKWLSTFKSADISRTAYYGNDWSNKTHNNIVSVINSVNADYKETIWDILGALTVSNPPEKILSGYLAKCISLFLNAIPDYFKDRMLHYTIYPYHIPLKIPPYNTISHITIIVQNLEKSLAWYEKIGFVKIGSKIDNCHFMKAGSSKCWKPMILLKEDICMVRQTCSSKLCIYTCDIHSVVKRLETLNICPSKINRNNKYNLAHFKDPDGFDVYFIEFIMPLYNIFMCFVRFFYKLNDPQMFHLTLNIDSYSKDYNALKMIGFTDILFKSPYSISIGDFSDSNIIALVKLPKDKFVITLTSSNNTNINNEIEYTLPDSISISVKNVEKKILNLKKYGLRCEQALLTNYPIFGKVLVAKVYVNDNCIELCEYIGESTNI